MKTLGFKAIKEKMFKFFLLLISFFAPGAIFISAKAFCPICTAAVVVGLGLSRWLKIDDTISGLWIGGILISSIGWTINWCENKKIRFYARNILISIAYYAIVVIPLWQYEIIGHPLNKLWGIDKLILGILVGSIVFLLSYLWYENIKAKRGKPHFPYQKIVMPVGSLAILSLVFYFLTRY